MSSEERRLRAIEDLEAIKLLKARYALYADAKYTDDHERKSRADTDAVARQQAGCFTEDAEWDAGQFGVLKGRDALFENFRDKPWRFAMHLFLNPIIEIDDSRATGKWTIWMLATDAAGGKPVHMLGYTDDEYRKVDGRWLISKISLTQKFLTGWPDPWTGPDGPASFTPGGEH